MGTDLNVNRLFEHKRTRVFACCFILLLLGGFLYLIFNGNHNKIGPVEVAIPSTKADKSSKQQISVDKVEGDAVFGDKIINYNRDTANYRKKK